MLGKVGLNTAFSSIAKVIGAALGLVSIGFVARGLGLEGFGEYSTVIAYLGIVQVLADLGLYSLLTREISQNPDKESELFGQFFTLRLLVAGGFLILAAGLIFLFPYSNNIKIGVILASSAFLFMSLTQLFMSVFQKYLQIYKAGISEIIGRAAQLGFVWFFFSVGGGLYHFLSAVVAGAAVVFLIDLIFVRGLIKVKLSANIFAWKQILKTTYPIAISVVFTILYFKVDTLMLSVIRTQQDVGIYNTAYKILEVFIFFPAAFVGLLLPSLSRYARENKEKFSKLIGNISNIITMAALPTLVLGFAFSYTIVSFIGGSEFLAAGAPLQVLFLAIVVIFFGTLYGNGIIALDLQKKAMWAYVIGFGINFVANLIFIPEYSYMGAAWTTFFTELVVTLYLLFIIIKKAPFKVSVPVLYKSLIAAFLSGLVVFVMAPGFGQALSPTVFIGTSFAGIATYLTAAYVLKLHKAIVLL